LPAKLEASQFHKLRGGLRNSFMRFQREKKGRVAFLGGSITYNHGWRDMVMSYLKEKFPETKFEFIAAGIPSTGTTPAAFRIDDDVLSKGTVDLLFEEAAVNDNSNGRTSLEQVRGMEGIVRRARNSNPTMDIVLMHFVDPSKMEDYRAGKTQDVISNHEKVAAHYKLPSINLALEVTKRIDAGEFTWEKDFKNLHPSPFGQKVYFNSMKTLLENAWYGFIADDDKISSHVLPNKLDSAAYDNGSYVSISTVKLKKGWSINSNWKPNKGERTRPGYSNVPMLISETPGATLKIKFEGNAIGINIASGLDAGTIAFSIDGNTYKELDLFTCWSKHIHLPWHYTLGAGLKYGKHTLKIKILDKKNKDSKGNACRIKNFFVNK
jgi:sialidase-1